MKIPYVTAIAIIGTFGLNGCVIYLDDPAKVTFAGQAISGTNGKPVDQATVWVHSKRPVFSLLPVDTFGIVGATETDSDGRFAVSAKVNWPATLLIQDDHSIGSVFLNTSEAQRNGLVIRLNQKRTLRQDQKAQDTPIKGG
jgi:hypothetical protein